MPPGRPPRRGPAPRGPPGRGPSPRGPPLRGASPGRGGPGRGTPGRGTPGRASPGRGAGPLPPAVPATPPPQAAPATPLRPPPPPVDEQKQQFQDLMSKKLTQWDRMMNTDREDERAKCFDLFCKLSDEEVDLANRTISKKKLREFIDVKIDYFDRLARASNAKLRNESVKKFQEVVDSEMALAKAAGRKHVLFKEEEDRKEKKLALEKEEISKKYQDERPAEKEKSADENRTNVYPHGMYGALTGMMPGMMPHMMPGMEHASMHPAMMEGHLPMAGIMPGMSPDHNTAAMFRVFSMQQRYNAPMGMQAADMFGFMPTMVQQQPPAMLYINQDQRLPLQDLAVLSKNYGTAAYKHVPGGAPPCSSASLAADLKEETGKPLKEAYCTTESLKTQPKSDVSKKLRLLTQLESAKCVLQKNSTCSDTSVAEEIRNRLRRINRLQMKVIDEIIGNETGRTSGVVSNTQPENFQRSELHDSTKSADTDEEENRLQSAQPSNESGTVTVEFTGFDEDDVHVITASALRMNGPNQAMCNDTTELLPVESGSRPEVIWERCRSSTTDLHGEGTIGDANGNYSYPEDRPPHIPASPVHYGHHSYIFPGRTFHHHEEPPLPLAVGYQAPPSFPAPTYSMLPPHRLAPPRRLPRVDQCDSDGTSSAASTTKPSFRSETVIILNRAKPTSGARTVQPVQQPAQRMSVPLTQSMAVQTGTVQCATALAQPLQLPSPWIMPQIEARGEEVGDTASSLRRFAVECEEYLQSITESVHEIVHSLRSLSSDSPQSLSDHQTGYADEDYGDEYSYDEEDDSSYDDGAHPSRKKGKPNSSSLEKRRSGTKTKEGHSLWGRIWRGVRNFLGKSPSTKSQSDVQVDQVVSRIQKLVQEVTQASNDVMAARSGIQNNEQGGQVAMPGVFGAEDKLWGLIDLESQLADELSEYRALDVASSRSRYGSLSDAEDMLRHLIEVETQVANGIGAWRQMSEQYVPQSMRYTRTIMYKAPRDVSSYSDSTSATPSGPFTPPSSSAGYAS